MLFFHRKLVYVNREMEWIWGPVFRSVPSLPLLLPAKIQFPVFLSAALILPSLLPQTCCLSVWASGSTLYFTKSRACPEESGSKCTVNDWHTWSLRSDEMLDLPALPCVELLIQQPTNSHKNSIFVIFNPLKFRSKTETDWTKMIYHHWIHTSLVSTV